MVEKYILKAITYGEYRNLVDKLVNEGNTTGAEKSVSRIDYTKLNRKRMARLDKTVVLSEPVRMAAALNTRPMYWLVITESWCGDAAQNIPVIEKIAAESGIIETRYILRDENLELMDGFLDNGARAIPKLVAVDRNSFEMIDTWGSRPGALKELYAKLKALGSEKVVISEALQRWYNTDKGHSLQSEFCELIRSWSRTTSAVVGV